MLTLPTELPSNMLRSDEYAARNILFHTRYVLHQPVFGIATPASQTALPPLLLGEHQLNAER